VSRSGGIRFAPSITTASLVYLPTLEIDPSTGDLDSPSTPRRSVKKLTANQRADVRRLAPTRSLRELAMTFEVSHETIRSVLQSPVANPMPTD
jgi:hypothetical protein